MDLQLSTKRLNNFENIGGFKRISKKNSWIIQKHNRLNMANTCINYLLPTWDGYLNNI